MPLSPTPFMNLIRPTPDADDGVWDTLLNDLIALIDSHRHITGEGRPIPTAGINIDAALSLNNFRLTNVGGVAMQNLGAQLTTGANEFFVSGGNAYFRNNSGVNVLITSGNTLAITTVGGIGGDYTAVVAEVAYSDAADLYTFKQQLGAGVRQYAKVAHADIQLFEYIAHPGPTVPINSVNIKSPNSLAASYTVTFPTETPASTALVQMSGLPTPGVLTASNTIANPVTLSSLLTAAAITASGLITANAGITAGPGQHVTVQTTGRFKHGTFSKVINSKNYPDPQSSWSVLFTGLISTAAGSIWLSPEFEPGDRIQDISLRMFGNAPNTTDATINIHSVVGGASTSLGTVTVNNVPAGWTAYAITGINHTVAPSESIVMMVTVNGGGVLTENWEIFYDRP